MKRATSKTEKKEPLGPLALGVAIAFLWFVMTLAASSRMYFLSTYLVGKMVEPLWEPFAATNIVVLFCFGIVSIWTFGLWSNLKSGCGPQLRAIVFLAISDLPIVLWIMRMSGVVEWSAQFCEGLWIAAWTGLSFGELARSRIEPAIVSVERKAALPGWSAVGALTLLVLLAGGWWFSQSTQYHQNFLLGYNDFGHFLQRVANTAEGRGLLLESPVLPMFWDHFNPGLLFVVPLWKLFPTVKLVFVLQAGALAVSSLLIYAISRRFGHSKLAALVFGAAWLAQPSVGQMNLAYTYGWHPITFAIPLLLATILCLLAKQKVGALICTLLALSMEEGVFVIVGLVAAVWFCLPFIDRRFFKQSLKQSKDAKGVCGSSLLMDALSPTTWFAVGLFALIGFVLVYQFSGLAEFQTGRFVALGNSPAEILMSPIVRPGVFWSQVLKLENVLFVLLLWLPCGLPSLLRGWRFLLPTLLPLGVLIVWDHAPAHNLAFQYPSTLLPLFWLACLSGAGIAKVQNNGDWALPSAATSLVTGLVLSLFVGQLPYSSLTLNEVEAMTYGAESESRRKSDAEDGQWLLQKVAEIHETKDECLATGRIAAHLVGNRDIETVGQYLLRRDQLSALPDRKGYPMKHYRWVILDRQDLAKWAGAETAEVEREARENGFEQVEDRFGVVILKRLGAD